MVLSGIPGAVIDKITKQLGLQTAVEGTSFDMLKTIQPIIEMKDEPPAQRFQDRPSSGTMITLSTKKDTFITGAWVSVADTNGGITNSFILATLPSGAPIRLVNIEINSAGVGLNDSQNLDVQFIRPIKLLRGSDVVLTLNGTGRGAISFYEVDV